MEAERNRRKSGRTIEIRHFGHKKKGHLILDRSNNAFYKSYMIDELFANAEWIIAKVPPEEQGSVRNELAQLKERNDVWHRQRMTDRRHDSDGKVLKEWAVDFDTFFARIRTVLSPAEQDYLQHDTTPALRDIKKASAKLHGIVTSLVPALPHEKRELPHPFPECLPLLRVNASETVERNLQWVADQIHALSIMLEGTASQSRGPSAPQER